MSARTRESNHKKENNKLDDSWSENPEDLIAYEKSVTANELKIFNNVNTLQKKTDIVIQFPTTAVSPPMISSQHPTTNSSQFKKASTMFNEQIQLNRLGSSQIASSQHAIIAQQQQQQQQDLLLLQQGSSSINMMASNQFIKGSTLLNNQYNEQATAYLKEIEQKNQNKFITQKEDLDIFKYLTLTYNVNTIVSSKFNSSSKHQTIPNEVYKVSIDSVKINNRTIVAKQTLNTMLLPQQSRQPERQSKNVYKNFLTFLSLENKPEMQLLVVELTATNDVISNAQPAHTLTNSFRMQDSGQLLQNYKAIPLIYHLNTDSSREPSPYIAFDKVSGRHFIYNNDDKVMVFSHKPIQNQINDKSKPLVIMSLEDKFDGVLRSDLSKSTGIPCDMEDSFMEKSGSQQENKARINPTLQIISDEKGNSALLVIGGYVETSNGTIIPKRNIKVFSIGKRQIDVKPAFTIALKHPRVNPIVIRVRQCDCKDANPNSFDQTKYLILLGGASSSTVEDKTLFTNTNTQCSVIEYDTIFNQLMRKDGTDMTESKTLKVQYNDKDKGKNHEKLAEKLSRGVFLYQRDKSNRGIHNKMFIVCDKRKQIFLINAISLQENFISIFDTDTELKVENSWSYTNICNIDNCIIYVAPQQFIPFIVETSGKNQKQIQSEEITEFNRKNRRDNIFEIIPNANVKSCKCIIF